MNNRKSSSWFLWSLLVVSASASAVNHNVVVAPNGDLSFDPKNLTINAGDTVTWQWVSDGTMPHNVVGPGFRCAQGCDGEGGNGNPTIASWTVTRTFTSPGTINYRCEVHAPIMSGTITVNAGSAFDLNRQGLTGSWFEMATAGQGVEVEVYPNLIGPGTGFLQGAWFTFDYKAAGGAASQRWYTFSGNVLTGQPSATLTIYQNTGGNFNALPVTNATPVGSVVFTATDCTHATMNYTFTDGSARSGTVPMTRLLSNVTCSNTGADTANADFGYSGNWFDRLTSGQGIVMEVNPTQPFAFLTWYTYAPNAQLLGEAGQRWYTGQASYTPWARTVPMTLFETTGGLFDRAAPVPNTVPVGTATAKFTSCTALQLDFSFTGGSSAGASGTINMSRVGPTPAGCGP